jgi:hypothetical protein
VGLAVVATGVLAILVDRRRPLGRRLKGLAIFGAVSLLPLLVWYVRNWMLTGSLTNRTITFHPPTLESLRLGVFTLTEWLSLDRLPIRGGPVLVLLAAGMLAALMGWSWARAIRSRRAATPESGVRLASLQMATLLGLFVILYCALLLTSLTFLDAATKLDNRILSPLYLSLLIIISLVLASLPRSVQRAGAVAGALLVGSYFGRSLALLQDMRLNGRGFNSRPWQTSETIGFLRDLPGEGFLYTNEPFPVRFLTGRPVYWVPEALDPVQGLPRAGYGVQMTTMRERLREPNSVLALFTARLASPEFPSEAEITEGLVVLAQTSDGVIYIDPGNRGAVGGE